jgi:hydroxyacylglutathione hydrolase
MTITQVAPEVFRISFLGQDTINCYLLEDLLVDSGPRFFQNRLIALLRGRRLTAHALTHGHSDHQGCSHAVCSEFDVPLWCGEGDRAAIESGDIKSINPISLQHLTWIDRWLRGPSHPVSRILREGDQVAGFRVMEVPGHTPGHLAFWRERDRVLVVGDVLFHRNPITWRAGLTEALPSVTRDLSQNRASAKRFSTLEPSVVCFGHGRELRDARVFATFMANMQAS